MFKLFFKVLPATCGVQTEGQSLCRGRGKGVSEDSIVCSVLSDLPGHSWGPRWTLCCPVWGQMSHNLVCTRIVQVAQLLSLAVLNKGGGHTTATPRVRYAGLPTLRKQPREGWHPDLVCWFWIDHLTFLNVPLTFYSYALSSFPVWPLIFQTQMGVDRSSLTGSVFCAVVFQQTSWCSWSVAQGEQMTGILLQLCSRMRFPGLSCSTVSLPLFLPPSLLPISPFSPLSTPFLPVLFLIILFSSFSSNIWNKTCKFVIT